MTISRYGLGYVRGIDEGSLDSFGGSSYGAMLISVGSFPVT